MSTVAAFVRCPLRHRLRRATHAQPGLLLAERSRIEVEIGHGRSLWSWMGK